MSPLPHTPTVFLLLIHTLPWGTSSFYLSLHLSLYRFFFHSFASFFFHSLFFYLSLLFWYRLHSLFSSIIPSIAHCSAHFVFLHVTTSYTRRFLFPSVALFFSFRHHFFLSFYNSLFRHVLNFSHCSFCLLVFLSFALSLPSAILAHHFIFLSVAFYLSSRFCHSFLHHLSFSLSLSLFYTFLSHFSFFHFIFLSVASLFSIFTFLSHFFPITSSFSLPLHFSFCLSLTLLSISFYFLLSHFLSPSLFLKMCYTVNICS